MLGFTQKDVQEFRKLRNDLRPLIGAERTELLERIESNMMNGKTVEKKRVSKKQRTIKYL